MCARMEPSRNTPTLIDVQIDGQTVTITRQLNLPFAWVTAKSAKAFKAMMGEWEAPVKVVMAVN